MIVQSYSRFRGDSLLQFLNRQKYRENPFKERFSLRNVMSNFQCTFDFMVHSVTGYQDLIPLMACKFSKENPHHLAVVDEEGGIVILNTLEQQHSVVNEWKAHNNAIYEVEWLDHRLLSGSADETLCLWDVASERRLLKFHQHRSSIKTISASPDRDVFASGGRDNNIFIWDARVNSKSGSVPAINAIYNSHGSKRVPTRKRGQVVRENTNHVTSVIHKNGSLLCSAGAHDSHVKVWDLRKTYSNLKRQAIPVDVYSYHRAANQKTLGYSSLCLDSTFTRLFASCLDSTVYEYNLSGCKMSPVNKYKAHQNNNSFYIRACLSPDDLYLLNGSSDGFGYIWRVESPFDELLMLDGHKGEEVAGVAWCPSEFSKFVTLGDDHCVKIWNLNHSDAPMDTSYKGRCHDVSHFIRHKLDRYIELNSSNVLPIGRETPIRSSERIAMLQRALSASSMSPSPLICATGHSGLCSRFESPKSSSNSPGKTIKSPGRSPLKSPAKNLRSPRLSSPQQAPETPRCAGLRHWFGQVIMRRIEELCKQKALLMINNITQPVPESPIFKCSRRAPTANLPSIMTWLSVKKRPNGNTPRKIKPLWSPRRPVPGSALDMSVDFKSPLRSSPACASPSHLSASLSTHVSVSVASNSVSRTMPRRCKRRLESEMTPSPVACKRLCMDLPSSLRQSNRLSRFASPTANLPNLVMDSPKKVRTPSAVMKNLPQPNWLRRKEENVEVKDEKPACVVHGTRKILSAKKTKKRKENNRPLLRSENMLRYLSPNSNKLNPQG